MARQAINHGITAGDGTGESLFDAFAKVNANETELYGHKDSTANPHGVTATQVGLGNVDNTADLDKPVSTATQAALDGKIVSAATSAGFPATGDAKSLYIALDTGVAYQWVTDAYVARTVAPYTDPTTGAVSLVGAGGVEIQPNPRRSRKVILIGDSITQQNLGGTTFNNTTGENESISTGYGSYWQARGYAEMANAMLGSPFTFVNAGKSGMGTAWMLTNLQLVLANHPDATEVWIHGGVNDLKPSGLATLSESVANITSMVNLALSYGMRVVWNTTVMAATGASGWANDQRNNMVQQVAQLKALFSAEPYVRYVDIVESAGALLDTSVVTGYSSTSYLYDDLHPSNYGALLWALKLVETISYRVPSTFIGVSNPADAYATDNTSTQLLDDPLHLAATGASTGTGVTGDLPTGLTAAFTRTTGDATAVASVVAAPDGIGKAIKLVVTAGTIASTFRLADVADSPATTIVAGGQYQAEFHIKCSGVTGFESAKIEHLASITSATTTTPAVYAWTDAGVDDGITYAGEFTLRVVGPVLTIPSDMTAAAYMRHYISIVFAGVGGGTFEIYRRSCRQLA